MNDLHSYLARVVSYWNSEYPGKPIGSLEENSPVRSLVSNCHHLGWSVPRCCSRINEMHFLRPAANPPAWYQIPQKP